MGKYTIIADVSQKIADLLSEGMVPDLIADRFFRWYLFV